MNLIRNLFLKNTDSDLEKHLERLVKLSLQLDPVTKQKILELIEATAFVIKDINNSSRKNETKYLKMYSNLKTLFSFLNTLKKPFVSVIKIQYEHLIPIKGMINEIVYIKNYTEPKLTIEEYDRRKTELEKYLVYVHTCPNLARMLILNWDLAEELKEMIRKKGLNLRTLYGGIQILQKIVTKDNILQIGAYIIRITDSSHDLMSKEYLACGYLKLMTQDIPLTEKTISNLADIADISKVNKIDLNDNLRVMIDMIECDSDIVRAKEYFLKILPYVKGTEKITFNTISTLREYFFLFKWDTFDKLITPTVKCQTSASFLCFQSYSSIFNRDGIKSSRDIELLIYIVEKKVRSANDILKNIIISGLKEDIISKPISKDADIIKEFIKTSPANLLELYVEFKNIYTGTKDNKHSHYENLFKETIQLKKEIITGTLTKDYNKNILIGVLFSVFSPEFTIERSQYETILAKRVDRQTDIPLVLNNLSGLKVRISEGGYVLKDEINTSAWNNLIEAVNEINVKTIKINPADVGINLLIGFNKRELEQKQKEWLKYIYAYNVQLGNSLPAFSNDHQTLMKYKEFVGDRMRNDLILSLLTKAKERYPKEFNATTQTEKDYKQFAKILYQVWNTQRADKSEIILKMIQDKGFLLQELKWQQYITIEQINTILINSSSNIVDKSLVQNIFNSIYGIDYEHMKNEMQKFEFKKESKGLFGKPYTFVLSKKKMHSVAMFNMGVCVAVDDKLWEQPDVWQMIIFDEENNACGGAIYRTIQEDNNTYLIVSIQPSSNILGTSSPNQVYDKIIQFSRTMVKKLGYTNLLIPQSQTIHSNRGSIQEIILTKNYPKIMLKNNHTFSYEPYYYEYQEFFIVT